MSRSRTAFYVAYFESLVVSVCGFVLLSGVLRGTSDYSSLQQWAVDTQFFFLCGTLVLQLLLSGIVKAKEIKGDEKENENQATSGVSDLLAPVANAYCSLCFVIFLVCMVMFAQISAAPNTVRSWVTAPNGMWYFHPTNISNSDCTTGTWSDVAFDISNVVNGTRMNGAVCLNQTRILYRGVHQFPDSITNGTLHFQSQKSDAVQMVFGNSYAASADPSAITTQSIAGSIAFGFVWAFVSVTLFVSCYASYSSTPEGDYCPLFLAPRCVHVMFGL